MNPVKLFKMVQDNDVNTTRSKVDKLEAWAAVLEIVFYVFISNFITELIKIGEVPTLGECYMPVLSSLLAALFIYRRVRNLNTEEEKSAE